MSDAESSQKMVTPSGLKALTERAGDQKGPAPVHAWNPPYIGEIDMRISADGHWFYEGGRIEREAMVRLFSTILRREDDGRFVMVTPVECYGITVDDAPFTAVELHCDESSSGPVMTFRTNVGDLVTLDNEHPIRFSEDPDTGGFKPYLMVRDGLEALLSRALVHELLNHAEEREIDGVSYLGLESSGKFFTISTSDALGL